MEIDLINTVGLRPLMFPLSLRKRLDTVEIDLINTVGLRLKRSDYRSIVADIVEIDLINTVGLRRMKCFPSVTALLAWK